MQADTFINRLFASVLTGGLAPAQVFVCVLFAIACGVVLSFVYRKNSGCSATFAYSLSALPFVVAMVIIAVNGNLGAGVAVAGAFSLVRFRSTPGNAMEITVIFLSMAIGLILGMGYIAFGAAFLIIACVFTSIRTAPREPASRLLRVTIPESLEFDGLFKEELDKYTQTNELVKVKTSNMGSLYDIVFRVTLKEPVKIKAFIDDLRLKNGNLAISLSHELVKQEEF